jgi:hypothetical protein
MSQNLRLALWVPQANPAAVGNAILTTAASTANKRIASQFAAAGSGGGGIAEAPLDGDSYVRADGVWVKLDGGTF